MEKKKKVSKPKLKKFLMLEDVGTNPDGSVKFPKGSMQELTRKQELNYKQNKII